jgi:hypothetical protein
VENSRRDPTPSRVAQLALLIGGYVTALYALFVPVQIRVWNGVVDLLVSGAMILPFIVLPLLVRLRERATRLAWILMAVMAVDLVFLAVIAFAPTGGHPSLEAIASLFLGMAKLVLVPVSLVLLSAGFLKGERLIVVATGFVCLLGEALYGIYPLDSWLSPSA